MELQKKKPGALLGIIIGMAAALSAFFSLLAPLVPAFIAYLGLAGGALPMFLALAVSGGGLYIMAGVTGLYLYAIIAAASLLLYALMKTHTPWFDTILFTSFAVIVGLYALFCLPDILAGRGAFDTVKEIFASTWEQYTKGMSLMGLFNSEDMAQAYETMGRAAIAQLPATFPFALVVLGFCYGLADVVIARRLSLPHGAALRPMVRFSLWRLPKGYLWGAALLWGGSAVAAYMNIANAEGIALCCSAVACLPLCMQGACTMAFLFRIRQARANLYMPFLLLMLLTFPYCLMALILFGLIEQCFKLRKRVLDSMQGPQ